MQLHYEIYRVDPKGEEKVVKEYEGTRPASHVMRQLGAMAQSLFGSRVKYIDDGQYGRWASAKGETLEMRLTF